MNLRGESLSPLCSLADREKLRKSQYKSGASSSTPEWRTSYRKVGVVMRILRATLQHLGLWPGFPETRGSTAISSKCNYFCRVFKYLAAVSRYCKRCKDRLSQSRERLVSRFRNIKTGTSPTSPTQQAGGGGDEGVVCGMGESSVSVDSENCMKMVTLSVEEVMKDEWEQMRVENSRLPHLTPYRNRRAPLAGATRLGRHKLKSPYASSLCAEDELESEDVDSVLAVIDELTQELIVEEQALLAQYQEMQAEVDLATIDSLSAGASVVCPICQKSFLIQDVHDIIYCVCGVQINTGHNGLTLNSLQEQLELCVTQHSTVCSGRPVFSLECTLGRQNIIMNCTACEFMFVVL